MGNYRPTSKLCQFAKIQENVVANQLFEVVQNQHDFCKKRGVAGNLQSFSELMLSTKDDNAQVVVCIHRF